MKCLYNADIVDGINNVSADYMYVFKFVEGYCLIAAMPVNEAMKTTRFERGDLCAFTWNNKLLVKRVVGLPGDWIEIDTDGTVYLNGDKLDEPYVQQMALGECDLEFPFQVPQEQYFVIGDMRESSIDSRNSLIGCIPKDQIVGKVFFRVWPFKSIQFF